ncbi:MAG: YjhX family toxin [Devosia sp.]|uniref:YjhX family toxin n=1 Tax=Devosia sp. TaxID=1871048 RepID=UPI001AD433D3|nr:YjhX family toxin [Devosia sp.]MBN9314329.1 YjhX family toxin [Devosia sp.]
MDISREEQRVLHALAQGGSIHALKSETGKINGIELYSRDGWLMPCTLGMFKILKNKKAIASANSRPYRITRRGLELVRAEVDNR